MEWFLCRFSTRKFEALATNDHKHTVQDLQRAGDERSGCRQVEVTTLPDAQYTSW
jgi:hypothetical protein